MSKKLLIDTLHYANMLEAGGVDCFDTHAFSLAEALNHNIYSKDEVDKMIEAAINQLRLDREKSNENFNRMLYEQRMEFRELSNKSEREMIKRDQKFQEIQNQIDKTVYKALYGVFYKTVGTVGALLVIAETLTIIIHHYIN